MSTSQNPEIESTVENAGPSRKQIKVRVPAEMVNRRIKETYGQLARDVNLPGFRKGPTGRFRG